MQNLSFKLPDGLKQAFNNYLYNESQQNKAADELSCTDLDHPNYNKLETAIDNCSRANDQIARDTCKELNITPVQFVDMLNEYNELITSK